MGPDTTMAVVFTQNGSRPHQNMMMFVVGSAERVAGECGRRFSGRRGECMSLRQSGLDEIDLLKANGFSCCISGIVPIKRWSHSRRRKQHDSVERRADNTQALVCMGDGGSGRSSNGSG